MNANELRRVARTVQHAVAKSSPTILTGLSVAGLVTTTVMAVNATPKALRMIAMEEDMREDEALSEGIDFEFLTKKEIVQLTWKCYIPAVTMCGVTILCIISANSINQRRNAALAGLYSLSETALKEYQAKVVETIGKNKEQKIKDEVAKDKIEKHPLVAKEVIFTGKGEALCYDALSGRYFKSDIEQIRRSLNQLGREMLSDMVISLNDVYYTLGLDNTKLGDLMGWHVDDGLVEPSFSSQLTEDGTPCLVLDFTTEPRYIYTD